MVTYISRATIGLQPRNGGGISLATTLVMGVALHWPGMAKPIDANGAIGLRRICSALRGWQAYHMEVKKWSDIAYQVAVDQAGRAYQLRGINIKSGANGDNSANSKYGAILLILAPGERPSAAMKATVAAVQADYRKRFPKVPRRPTTHNRVRLAETGSGTTCPGPLATAAVDAGSFDAGTVSTPPPVTPPPVTPPTPTIPKDWFDMATPEQIKQAFAEGGEMALANYMRKFFADEAGTGDAAMDESRAGFQNIVNAVAGATDESVLTAVQDLGSKVDANTAAIRELIGVLKP